MFNFAASTICFNSKAYIYTFVRINTKKTKTLLKMCIYYVRESFEFALNFLMKYENKLFVSVILYLSDLMRQIIRLQSFFYVVSYLKQDISLSEFFTIHTTIACYSTDLHLCESCKKFGTTKLTQNGASVWNNN